MKKPLKIVLWVIGVILVILLGSYIAFQVSPKPGVWLIASAFNGKVEIQDTAAYNRVKGKIGVINTISYDSKHKMNVLDIYYPTGQTQLPVLFWVHGGGFIGGNNRGVHEFATYIAAESNMAVILVDYEKAPDLHYPGQTKQLAESMYVFRQNFSSSLIVNLSLFAAMDSANHTMFYADFSLHDLVITN